MKKIITLLCCVSLLSLPVSAKTVFFEEESGETVEQLTALGEEESVTVGNTGASLEIGGKSAVLMELSTGQVLYEKNPTEHLPIASVTKIMTLLLVMEAVDTGLIDLQENVTCSDVAASMGGSQIWLETGEVMTVHDLIKAAAVVSANDACAALAEHIAGSIEEFVARMNTRAAALGMTDTLFKDCSGLDDTAYSCARDVALMSRELMKHPTIKNYTTIWMDTLRGGESALVNTNKLVRFYKGATGLKTGTTSAAGHNLSATAERDGLGFVAVVLGCSTTDERFGGARKLLDHGFANYTLYTPEVLPDALTPVPVLRGTLPSAESCVDTLPPLLIKKGESGAYTTEVRLDADAEAPVEQGQIIGSVVVLKDGEAVGETPVRAAHAVPRLTLGTCFVRLLSVLAV